MNAVALGLQPLDVAALTLHHEAGGERLAGLIAVAAVLRNRVAWGRWGSTIEAVCLAPKQFSCWRPSGGSANYMSLETHAELIREGRRPTAMARAYDVAEAIFDDGLPDPTGGADHYYAPAAMAEPGSVPSWAKGVQPCAVIGGHRFFRLRPA